VGASKGIERRLKILHLFSDWKWTGPAEPVVNLCWALKKRGHEVILSYCPPPFDVEKSIRSEVQGKGIKTLEDSRLRPIAKAHHILRVIEILRDITQITKFIDEEGIDIVNAHNSHDHIVGGLAAMRSYKRSPVIRTDHKRDSLAAGPLSRRLFQRYTDGFITFSEMGKKRLTEEIGIAPKKVIKVHPALDFSRFNRQRSFKDMRSELGIPHKAPIIGIVARFQRYRNTELLLHAFSQLIKETPETRLLLVGRSSQMRESIIIPMKRIGIEDHVILAGYRDKDYFDTLASMDVFVLISPGSDGTARALREAMVMGKPAVVTRRGMLPELVEDGVHGFVVDERPEALCQALVTLIKDERLRTMMGNAAHEMARREFRIERQAEEVEGFYRHIMEVAKGIL
jgi:glycosyltransferase involved in cell wall biosynthesis